MSKRSKRRNRPRTKPSQRSRPSNQPSLEKPDTGPIANNKLTILMALLAVLGSGYLYHKSDCNQADNGRNKVERVQTQNNLAAALRPHLQSQFVLPESQNKWNQLKSKFYPLTLNIQAWITQLKKVASQGFNNATPEERELLREMITDIMKTGVFEELTKLRQTNDREVPQKNIHIALVPLEHWSPETGHMSAGGIDCARDVNAIVEAVREFSPKSKLFMEGIDVKGLITEDSISQSTLLPKGRDAKGLRIMRKYYPWILDGKSPVYGAEHGKFFNTYVQYTDSAEYKAQVSDVSSKTILILFQQLLREQLAVERAISKVKDGESGYIFYGAAHIVGMAHYINDRFKGKVKSGALVPKHLVVRGR